MFFSRIQLQIETNDIMNSNKVYHCTRLNKTLLGTLTMLLTISTDTSDTRYWKDIVFQG